MKIRRLYLVLLLVSLSVLLSACGGGKKAEEDEDNPMVFDDDRTEYVLATVFDLSGSYRQMLDKDDGKALMYFSRLKDQFFRDRLGADDRILLAQISRKEKAVLYDGSPRAFQSTFPSVDAFRKFLLDRSDPHGSRVYSSIADTIDAVVEYHEKDRSTKSAVFVFSDMDENFPHPEESRARLLASMQKYAKKGGLLFIYWCDSDKVQMWKDHCNRAGFRKWEVKSDTKDDLQVPSFN